MSGTGAEVELKRFTGDPREDTATYTLHPEYKVSQRREATVEDEQVLSKKERQRFRLMNKNIRVSFISEAAERHAEKARLLGTLPFYLVFLALVLIELFIAVDTEEAYWSTSNLGTKIATEELTPLSQDGGPFWGKTFMDTANSDDWYDWLNNVVLGLLFDDENVNARTYVNNVVSGNNIKIGSMRLRVVKVNNDSCTFEKRWLPTNGSVFPLECWSNFRSKVYNKTEFGPYKYRRCFNYLMRRTEAKTRTWSCSGIVHDVPFSLSRTFVNREMEELQENNFVDASDTRFVMLSVITYNPSLSVFSLAQSFVEITEGGTFLPQYRTIQFPFMRTQDKVMTILLLFATIMMTVVFIKSYKAAKLQGKGLAFLLDLWNLLSLINYILLYVMLGTRFAYWDISVRTDFQLDNEESPSEYRESLEYVAVLFSQSVLYYSAITAITMLTIQKYLSLNPRLSVLTRSLAAAQQDLVGLLALFITILLAYSITGNALFGAGVADYRNIEVSFSSLMRTLIGDFDYDALREENYVLAGMFFWSYLLLGLFLMLNFIIAVIGNSFEKENSQTKAQPFYDQLSEYLELRYRATRRFLSDPKGWFERRKEAQEHEFQSKFSTLQETAFEYRKSLPLTQVTNEQFATMLPEEQAEVMEDPFLTRGGFEKVIRESEDGPDKLQFLTEGFLDEFWLEIAIEYELHHGDEENQRRKKRHQMMEDCAERQLKYILGLSRAPVGSTFATPETLTLPELFAPTKETLNTLEQLQTRVDSIESSTNEIATLVGQLTQLVTSLKPVLLGRTAEDSKLAQTGFSAEGATAVYRKPKSDLEPP